MGGEFNKEAKMTVLDVVCSAIKILGDFEFYEYLIGKGEEQDVYVNDKELLIIAYNQAIETAVNYCPLYYTETFTPTNGSVNYKKFSYNPYKIIKITTTDSFQSVEILPTEIKTDGKITVEYVYVPTVLDFEEVFVYQHSPLSKIDVAYGVLSEYLIYKGRFEEASTFLDKFITALKNSSGIKKVGKVKQRTWF